jgi:hypothetical protein
MTRQKVLTSKKKKETMLWVLVTSEWVRVKRLAATAA